MTYRAGDRVMVDTAAGEVPGVVRRADPDAGTVLVVVAGLLTLSVSPSALRPLDDRADRPYVVDADPE